MDLLASTLRTREVYDLMTSLIVPRAIAWVSTKDRAGKTNLAPFSYFTGLGSDPPLVTLGISDRRDGTHKDTLRIARETGVLCINLVEEPDSDRMNASSGEYAPGTSELDVLGIETVPCTAIDGVRVKSSRAALECALVDVHPYGERVRVNLVVARVLSFHLDEALTQAGEHTASPHLVQPVARLGGAWYGKLGERFARERPRIP